MFLKTLQHQSQITNISKYMQVALIAQEGTKLVVKPAIFL